MQNNLPHDFLQHDCWLEERIPSAQVGSLVSGVSGTLASDSLQGALPSSQETPESSIAPTQHAFAPPGL